MKDFDITKAKQGHPVIRRDGRAVRIICFDRKCDDGYPIVTLIVDEDGEEQIQTYTVDGRIYADQPICISTGDLMLKTKKREGWVNVYKTRRGNNFGLCIYDSKEKALEAIETDNVDICDRSEGITEAIDSDVYVDTVKIEWEE